MAYTTLARVKSTLRAPAGSRDVPSWDTGGDFDDLLTATIQTAETAIDNMCGRTFDGYTGRSATRVFTAAQSNWLLTDDFASTPTSVEGRISGVRDNWRVAVPPAGTRPGHSITGNRLFLQGEEVEVVAVWGWRSVPPPVITAATLYAVRLFKRSDSPVGLAIGDMGAAYISKTDPDIAALLAPYRGRGLA